MRLAPVPLFYAHRPEAAANRSADSSRSTHGAESPVDACRYFGALISGAVNEVSKEELLSERYGPSPGYWEEKPLAPEIYEVASGSFKCKESPEIEGSGYVVRSLEAALWALYESGTFEEGCLLAANLGDDADTTAAVYGQLAGAFYGEAAIPESWRKKVAQRRLIEDLAEKLLVRRLDPE